MTPLAWLAMNQLNALLTALADWLLSPWVGWPPWLPLVVISVVAGILIAIVFRFTSPQNLLRRDAQLIQAQLLAMKLFKDDFRTMFDCLAKLFRYTGRRLWHSLPPMLVMAAPFVLLLAQLARWYEYLPLVPGDQALIELQITQEAWPRFKDVTLEPADYIVTETPSLRDDQEHTIYWRIQVERPQPVTLRWRFSQQSISKLVAVADQRAQLRAVDSRRPGAGWWDRLLHPGELPLAPDVPVGGIVVHHPQRSTQILGFDLPWWGTFLIVSMLSAVLVRPIVKVQF